MKASSVRNPKISLLSILLVAWYVSATIDEPIPVISPTSTATITVVANEPSNSSNGITGAVFGQVFDAPNGPVTTVVVYVAFTAQTTSNTEDETVAGRYSIISTLSISEPQGNQTVDTTNPIVNQSVTPTAAATDQGSITIQSVTPAATSTAPAAGTSGTSSVGSRFAWSMSLILPWIAAVLSI